MRPALEFVARAKPSIFVVLQWLSYPARGRLPAPEEAIKTLETDLCVEFRCKNFKPKGVIDMTKRKLGSSGQRGRRTKPVQVAQTPSASTVPLPPKVRGFAEGSPINRVPFAVILDWSEAYWTAVVAVAPSRAAEAKVRAIGNLRPFWTQLSGQQMKADPETLSNWTAHRKSTEGTGSAKTKKIKDATALNDVSILRGFVNQFKAEHGLAGNIDFGVSGNPAGEVDWFERDQIARLLWALRGYQWVGGAWKVDDDGKRVRDEAWLIDPTYHRAWDTATQRWTYRASTKDELARLPRRPRRVNAYEWLGRYILFLIYSGSTGACARRLKWEGTADGDNSFVDLDTKIEDRTGHLYRLGADKPGKLMVGIPVALSRRLAAHLRRWRELDAQHGFAHVLHQSADDHLNGHAPDEPVANAGSYLMEKLCERAGLKERDLVSKLGDTAVVWVLRSGARTVGDQERYKPPRAIMRSVAMMIGSHYDNEFLLKYESCAPAFLRRQMNVLYKPAATVRR